MKKHTYILIILSLFIFSVATYGITIYHKNVTPTNTSGLQASSVVSLPIGDYHELCIKNQTNCINKILTDKNILNKCIVGEWIYYIPEAFDSIFKVKLDGTQNTKVCSIDMMLPFNPKEMKIESIHKFNYDHLNNHDHNYDMIDYKITSDFKEMKEDTPYPSRVYSLNTNTATLTYDPEFSFPRLSPPSIFSSPFDIIGGVIFCDAPDYIYVEALSYVLNTPITYNTESDEITIKNTNFTLKFSTNSNQMTINDTIYNYSNSPYISGGLFFIPATETCKFIANYILNNNAYLDFFTDLSNAPQLNTPPENDRLSFLFFYKDNKTSDFIPMPIYAPLITLEETFNIKYTSEICGERIFYNFTSPYLSGYYVKEYRDNDLKVPVGHYITSMVITSPNFLTDRLIHVGSTREEVIRHYGNPSPEDPKDVWCTFPHCSGAGFTFYFKDDVVEKIQYNY